MANLNLQFGKLVFLLIISGSFSLDLSAQMKSHPLFNGKDLIGWHADVPEKDTNPQVRNSFIVRNGMLVSLGTPEGHLITDSVYSNFRLEFEYRFAGEPGNCGVLINASTPRALYKMFPKSIEVQMEHKNAGDFWCIVEDISVPDMVKRRGPQEHFTGGRGSACGKRRRPDLNAQAQTLIRP